MKLEDKIKAILTEGADYEVIGGPTPSETQKTPLDYAKNVKPAPVPQTHTVAEDETIPVDENPPTDVIEDEDEPVAADEDGDEKDMNEAEEEKDEDEIEKTFSEMLTRLKEDTEDGDEDEDDEDDVKVDDAVNEDETSLKADNGGTPKETLPGEEIDSLLDKPQELVTQAPGVPVAESKKSRKKTIKEDAPKETLPGQAVDSKLDTPGELVTQAPGVPVAEGENNHEDGCDCPICKNTGVKEDEDTEAMFKGEDLPESFKRKARIVFEAAVARRVAEEKTRITKKASAKLTEAFKVLKTKFDKKSNVFESKLTKKVDRYLGYVVENWMGENKLAVERGIRNELAENFIQGLKKLFVENYIEVPESKVDVVKTMGKKITKLESKLNEAVETNIKMRNSLAGYRKEEVIRSVSSGLTDTQVEKLRKLAENTEYTNRKEFAAKLTTIREAYMAKAPKAKKEETPVVALTEEVAPATGEMGTYVATLSKFKKN